MGDNDSGIPGPTASGQSQQPTGMRGYRLPGYWNPHDGIKMSALQLLRFILVTFACIEIVMLIVFWTFCDSLATSASAAVMPCIGATAALLGTHRIMPRTWQAQFTT